MNNAGSSDQRSEKEIFFAALEQPTPEARAAFLEGACGKNPLLRQRIEKLLADHFEEDSFLQEAAVGGRPTVTVSTPIREGPGSLISRYKLLERIGEGGFGEVWMADQREPVKRRVALKIIKLGMDSKQVVARFEAERQALALMDHANIAKIFDAGTTDAGRPYFVMELVRGVKITDYCDQNQLPTEERLKLFILVCQAIQHAHQKGVIHRDIKPSNILVTLHDGAPVPKVIDFGIAKATQQELTNQTLFTQFQQFIGTPAYISPEQAEMSGLDIDTRADIYSLGVLLYELLVSQTPFDAKEMMKGGIDALRQTIREREPMRPSTKLTQQLVAADESRRKSTQGLAVPTQEEISADSRRRLRLKEQIALLRGDLDWIVMKCLEKDRARRYETANGLARDIQRYLANEPIVARPPSTGYKIQKAWQRNKVVFTAGSVVALALVVGTGVSTWQALRATRANRAEVEQRVAAQAAQAAAQVKQQEAEQEKQRADREAVSATSANATAQRIAYSARMLVAQADWDNSNLRRLRDILTQTESYPDRGFEWYYWQRMCQLDLLTFREHSAAIHSLAFCPDGKRVVSGDRKGMVKVWDADTGRVLLSFKEHAGKINSLAFSADGRRVVSGSEDGRALVWDAESGRVLVTFEAHSQPVRSVAFSQDGRRVVSGSQDGTVRVWDAESGRAVYGPFRHFAKGVSSVAFSPNGRCVVSGCWESGTVIVWNLETAQPLFPPTPKIPSSRTYGSAVEFVAYSPDGRRIVCGLAGGSILVWDAETGQEILRLKEVHAGGVDCVTYTRDGRWIVSSSGDRTVKLWDTETGAGYLTLKGHESGVHSVDVSRDGHWIVSGSDDGTAKIWRVDPNRELIRLNGGMEVFSVDYSRDGRRFVSGGAGGLIRVWNATTGLPALTVKDEEIDGRHNWVTAVAFSPDGQRIVTGRPDSTVKIWDAGTGRPLLSITNETRGVHRLALSPDGLRIAGVCGDRTARVWDAGTGRELMRFTKHSNDLHAVAFSPDVRRIATAGFDAVRVWEAESGHELLQFTNHANGVLSCTFSPDGRQIVSGGWDHFVRVWDAETGRELLPPLKGHTTGVTSVRFSPDGRRILTTSFAGEIKLWESGEGRELLALKVNSQEINCAVFSPDGRRIVTGDNDVADRTLKVWNAMDAPGVTGTVHDAAGNPVPGLRVTLEPGAK